MKETPSMPSYPTDLNDLECAILDEILGDPPKLGRPPRFERCAVLGPSFTWSARAVRGACSRTICRHGASFIITLCAGGAPGSLKSSTMRCGRRRGKSVKKGNYIHCHPWNSLKRSQTAAILDSQSLRTTRRGGVRGHDAGKKVVGRKRHLLVDTDGLILKVRVHAANLQDRDGARLVGIKVMSPAQARSGSSGRGWSLRRLGEGLSARPSLIFWDEVLGLEDNPRRAMRRRTLARAHVTPPIGEFLCQAAIAVASAVMSENGLDQFPKLPSATVNCLC